MNEPSNTGMPSGMPPGMPPGMNQEQLQRVHQETMMNMVKTGKPLLCRCGCTVFKEGIQIIRSSPLDPSNVTGREQLIHVPALYCVKCSNPIDTK